MPERQPDRKKPRVDPLHGVTLETVLETLLKRHGWAGLARRMPVRCFQYQPSVKSSLAFLRATPWARAKIETWYKRELPRPARPAGPAKTDPGITTVAATLLKLLGVTGGLEPGAAPADARVLALAPEGVKKILVYAPDAIGRRLAVTRPDLFPALDDCACIDLRSAVPAKTPVCFASMFSGLAPAAHGITQYEKPVLKCKTIFDALPAAGLRAAIVAVKDSSIDLIFKGRPVDYFTEADDAAVTARALELIAAGGHDLLLAYHQEYDDILHEIGPWKEPALAAAARHGEAFGKLLAAFDARFADTPRAAVFAPDHGAHTDPATGKGVHGDDIPADMDVSHFWKCGK